MYIWTETTVSQGSREIKSCLDKFLKEQVLKEDEIFDHLIVWSESCGGQNRNFITTCFFLRVFHEDEWKVYHSPPFNIWAIFLTK